MDTPKDSARSSKSYDELMGNLKKRVAKIKESAEEKAQEDKKDKVLPFWPEEVRSVPNAILRGALFTVSKERAVFKELTPIASVDGIEIRYMGQRLNQVDLDLWEMLLHLQRLNPLGDRVEFTAHSMLKALGRGTSGADHETLNNGLARLIGNATEVKWPKERKAFAGSLVSSYFRDEDTGRYVVKFNQDMATLYGQGHTYIDLEQRQALGQNNLAKWLHGFYSSHADPFGYKVETLQRLCGSTASRTGFRRMLKVALEKLVEVGAIVRWRIDNRTDVVTVEKEPTPSQKLHLSKEKKR
mgnify:FL=1|jgi:hypothetical protein